MSFPFRANRCSICYLEEKCKPKTKLLTCSSCRLVSYCGVQHQKLDWPIHKDFCLAVKFVLEKNHVNHPMEINGQIASQKDFEKTTENIKCLVRSVLGRELESHEGEYTSFPKHCSVCFTHKTKGEFDCQMCGVGMYCSKEHKIKDFYNHNKICWELKMCYVSYPYNEDESMPEFKCVNFIDIKIETHLFHALENSARDLEISKFPSTRQQLKQFAYASSFSCVATILYALQMCNFLQRLEKSLVLYIVGAKEEMLWFKEAHCRFLMFQLPTVKNMKIFLIGPEQVNLNPVTYSINSAYGRVKVEISIVNKLFEEYINECTSGTKPRNPDLIVCFNPGFSEYANTPYHTWEPALKDMAKRVKTPILFTSYTKLEAELDFNEIFKVIPSHYVFGHILTAQRNPFRDYRPMRNWETADQNDPIYYRNAYFQMLMMSTKKT